MAPLIKEFEKYPADFRIEVCVTAQHREMLDQVLSLFEIEPDFDLNLMKPGQNLYDITASVLLEMEQVLKKSRPDFLLVQGDTTTTFAAALAAFYQKIPVGHIEAGLRTGDLYSPWPEEANRQLTDRISTYYFAPTAANKQNLLAENISAENIVVTGNTVIDALFFTLDKIGKDPGLADRLGRELAGCGYSLSEIFAKEPDKKIVLVTGHRRENFGQGFINICEALKEIALKYPGVDIVYPVHLNPNVRKPVGKILSGIENIFLIEPLNYLQFVYLMSKSYIIITDSGGVQEEAPSLGKPVIVIRDVTEREEAAAAGTVKIVGTDKKNIVSAASLLLEDTAAYEKMSKVHNPYGDGEACRRIIDFLNPVRTGGR